MRLSWCIELMWCGLGYVGAVVEWILSASLRVHWAMWCGLGYVGADVEWILGASLRVHWAM